MEIYTDRVCLIYTTPGDSPFFSISTPIWEGQFVLRVPQRHGNSWVEPGTSSFKAKAG